MSFWNKFALCIWYMCTCVTLVLHVTLVLIRIMSLCHVCVAFYTWVAIALCICYTCVACVMLGCNTCIAFVTLVLK